MVWWMLLVFVLAVVVVAAVIALLRGAGRVHWPLSRRVRTVAVALPLLAVLGVYGGILVYTKLINDPADALTTEDLGNVFTDDSTVTTVAPTTTVASDPTTTAAGVPATTAIAPATSAASSADAGALDGVWNVDPTDASTTFGYRVQEVLGGVDTTATGRGNEIDGSITIAGTTVTEGSFTVQVASITSDRSQRDGQFTGRIMQTSQFPTATFTITQPVDLGTIPADGEQVTASVTGDLTLHGVTNSVTFDVTAQTDGTTIGVLGEIPIVFADYGIDNPSTGFVTTEDNGLLEFILVFTPAG